MLKFFGIVGLVGGIVTFYLVTYGVGPERQLPPAVSLLEGFREDGFLPETRNLGEDEVAEDAGVFTVPAQDEVVYEAALEAMGDMDMGGMDMSGTDGGSMAGMDMAATDSTDMSGMDMSGADSGSMAGMDMAATDSTDMSGMDMSGADNGSMAGMDMAGNGDAVLDMDMNGDGIMDMSSAEMGNMAGMDMSGAADTGAMAGMDMSGSDGGSMAGMDMSGADSGMGMGEIPMGEGGLGFAEEAAFDRVIELTMTEWGYSEMSIDVKMGETIKFVVKNEGEIPHEFMFMNAPLMAAANYRGTRADWNLYEHEALFEQALILPGGDFEFVMQVQATGSWMFMCMLPYHMQMGMMGQMSTPGAAMDMDM